MSELLSALAVTATVRDALLGEGPLAPMLSLVAAYERGDWGPVVLEGRRQGLDEFFIAEAYESAVAGVKPGSVEFERP